jgi:hypothetical protein
MPDSSVTDAATNAEITAAVPAAVTVALTNVAPIPQSSQSSQSQIPLGRERVPKTYVW